MIRRVAHKKIFQYEVDQCYTKRILPASVLLVPKYSIRTMRRRYGECKQERHLDKRVMNRLDSWNGSYYTLWQMSVWRRVKHQYLSEIKNEKQKYNEYYEGLFEQHYNRN
jgi:hypothetical protein